MTKQASKPKAIVLFEGATAISKEIAGIKSASAKLDQRIQVAALSVASHAQKHGDITLAEKLVDALGKGHRKTALVDWLIAFGPFAIAPDESGLVYSKRESFDMDAAQAKPWYDFKPETPFKAVKLADMLDSLLKKAEGALKDEAHAEQHEVDPAQLAALKELRARWAEQ